MNPDNTLRKFGIKLYELNELHSADLVLHEYLKSNRQDQEVIGFIGDIHEKMGNFNLAIQNFRVAEQLALAKGSDATDYQNSIIRMESLQSDASRNHVRQPSAPNDKKNETAKTVRLRPSRAIMPYFGFPEKADDNTNMYGFIVNDGLPGMDMPYIPDSDTDEFIVGIFGGSIACAFYQAAVDKLTTALGAHPSINGRPVTVLNFSMGGMKQPEQMITMSYFSSVGQKFDLVINMDGLNDLAGGVGNLHEGHHIGMPPADITKDFMIMTGLPQLSKASMQYHLSLIRNDQWLKFIEEAPFPMPGRKYLTSYLRQRREVIISRKPEFDEGENLICVPKVDPIKLINTNDNEIFERKIGEIQTFWFNCVRNMIFLCRGLGITYVHALAPTPFFMHKSMGPEDMQLLNSLEHLDYYRRMVRIGYPAMIEAIDDVTKGLSYAYNCKISNMLEGMGDNLLTDAMGHFADPVYNSMVDEIMGYLHDKNL